MIDFGDNVRVLVTDVTQRAGIAGKIGQVYGITIPSTSGAQVLGELSADYAINVYFEDLETDFWLPEELIEFIDHGAGAEMIIGNIKTTRNEDGTWTEEVISKKKFWQFWK